MTTVTMLSTTSPGGSFDQTSNIAGRLVRKFITWRRQRATIQVLSGLDDHMLKDIGVARGNIRYLALKGSSE